jgi:hypothetical protein
MAVATVKVRIPVPNSALLINLLGVLGLLGAAVSVGGLTHNWWWSGLIASAAAVYVSVVGAGATEARPEPLRAAA